MTAVQEVLFEDATMVALKDLRLDPNNVRFRHIARQMSEAEMEEWLFNEEDVRVLLKQIVRDRRVQQPIYVTEDSHGKYVVKEGNRRTVALRRIQRDLIKGKIEGLEKDHFDLVPIHILKGTEHEINIFLGQIHVSGAKAWNAVNKGSLIYCLMEEYGDTLESVAEELGQGIQSNRALWQEIPKRCKLRAQVLILCRTIPKQSIEKLVARRSNTPRLLHRLGGQEQAACHIQRS